MLLYLFRARRARDERRIEIFMEKSSLCNLYQTMFRNRIDFLIRLKICLQLNFVNVIHFLFFYIDRFFFQYDKIWK